MGNTGQTVNRTVIFFAKTNFVTEMVAVFHAIMTISLDLQVAHVVKTFLRDAKHVMV